MKEENNGLEDCATHFARYIFCFSEIFQVLFISFIFVTIRSLPYG